jgi:cytochrome c-type biogenesis protein CcmH/NrfG
VRLSPKDPSVQFQLAQTAEQAQDTKTAVAAYKTFLKLAPEDPLAAPVRQRVKQMEKQQLPTASASTG